MGSRIFTNGLVVKNRKSAVILEVELENKQDYSFEFCFTDNEFREFVEYIKLVSDQSWKDVVPKEAQSFGADYYEYYDRSLDNNGYLSVAENQLKIERPSLESNKLYQFNKRKMESFLYDLKFALNNVKG